MSSKSTEVAAPSQYSAEELAIMEAQAAEMSSTDLHVPILKVGQSLSREVKAGDAEEGEFINTLTGYGVGSKVGFIVAYYSKGRAGSEGPGERYYTSSNFEIIPPHWGDWLGEQWVGQRFDEHPDAEEQYAHRVNVLKEIPWGSGPKISTTHNYTGFVLVSGEGGEADSMAPVRLSLKRGDMETVRRLHSMFQMNMRNQPYYSRVLDLSTIVRKGKGSEYYGVAVKLGRETTQDERQQALELAMAVRQGRVTDNADKTVGADNAAPASNGGLAV